MTQFLNFLLYQIGWFACVLGVAWGYQWQGIVIALMLAGVHLWLAKDRKLQVRLMCLATVLGLIVDSAQLWWGVFSYPRGQIVNWLPPPSMPILWLQFATIFRYCLHWLRGRYLLSAFFGLVGAPLAFLAGESLGAIEFLPPRIWHLAALGVLWSLSVPLLVFMADALVVPGESEPGYRWLDRERKPS